MLKITPVRNINKVFRKQNLSYISKNLPIQKQALVLYSLKAARNVNNNKNRDNKIKEQDNLLKEGKINENEYEKNVKKIEDYYEQANKLPEEISSKDIKKDSDEIKLKGKNVSHKGSPENGNDIDLEEADYDSLSDSATETNLFGNIKERARTFVGSFKERLSLTFKSNESEPEKIPINEWLDKNADKEKLLLDDVLSIDTSLPPNLQAVLDEPPLEATEGFLSTIKDYVSDGNSDDIFEKMKEILEEIDGLI